MLPNFVCFVTFWLHTWAWRHRRNMYFNVPLRQIFKPFHCM